jgi:hypothetical protein
VHVLFWLFAGESLAILGSWKKFTSRRINAMVKRRGMLWQDESYDHLTRQGTKKSSRGRFNTSWITPGRQDYPHGLGYM